MSILSLLHYLVIVYCCMLNLFHVLPYCSDNVELMMCGVVSRRYMYSYRGVACRTNISESATAGSIRGPL